MRMYDRHKAVQYAENYWNRYNPQYRYFSDNDCTNFVSQVLHAGGLPMEKSSSQGKGWWYQGGGSSNDRWSYSWSVAHVLYHYLGQGTRATRVQSASQLLLGDVICYDWDGDGRWNHNAVVTYISGGVPYVSAHSINRYNHHWAYEDSSAYTDQTRYTFFHIK
jgi:hypothetical protein